MSQAEVKLIFHQPEGWAVCLMTPGRGRGRRQSRVNFSIGRRHKQPDPEAQKKLARKRWKHAYRKVLAYIRFQIPLTDKPIEDKPPVNYAPTYKLAPDPDQKFNPARAKICIEKVLMDRLQTYEYGRFTAPKLVKLLSAYINDKMKELGCPRYKFVTNVIILENKHQDVCVTSRCVWNPASDEYATVEVKGHTFAAVAYVHAVYMD